MNNDIDGLNNILNDNDRFKGHSLNNIPEDAVERIATMLLDKLGNRDSWPYYCKVARLIPSTTLERLANTAKEVGDHPGRLFTYLTKQEIKRFSEKTENLE